MPANMMMDSNDTQWEPVLFSRRPNRKGTLRHNPFAKFLKKGGLVQVDQTEFSLNKKKRWSTLTEFNREVENGNSTIHVSKGKRQRRRLAFSSGPANVNQLILSVHTPDHEEPKTEVPAPMFKMITTRKGTVAVKLREKGKRVAGKHEGARAKRDDPNSDDHLHLTVTPAMVQGHYPLQDTKGRTTRPWNKGAHHTGRDRNTKMASWETSEE
jgi:hypothetical protein